MYCEVGFLAYALIAAALGSACVKQRCQGLYLSLDQCSCQLTVPAWKDPHPPVLIGSGFAPL